MSGTVNERTRFEAAFNALLEENPHRAPGPTEINKRMGRKSSMNKLPGRLSTLRIEMLRDAGFIRQNYGYWGQNWRWVKG